MPFENSNPPSNISDDGTSRRREQREDNGKMSRRQSREIRERKGPRESVEQRRLRSEKLAADQRAYREGLREFRKKRDDSMDITKLPPDIAAREAKVQKNYKFLIGHIDERIKGTMLHARGMQAELNKKWPWQRWTDGLDKSSIKSEEQYAFKLHELQCRLARDWGKTTNTDDREMLLSAVCKQNPDGTVSGSLFEITPDFEALHAQFERLEKNLSYAETGLQVAQMALEITASKVAGPPGLAVAMAPRYIMRVCQSVGSNGTSESMANIGLDMVQDVILAYIGGGGGGKMGKGALSRMGPMMNKVADKVIDAFKKASEGGWTKKGMSFLLKEIAESFRDAEIQHWIEETKAAISGKPNKHTRLGDATSNLTSRLALKGLFGAPGVGLKIFSKVKDKLRPKPGEKLNTRSLREDPEIQSMRDEITKLPNTPEGNAQRVDAARMLMELKGKTLSKDQEDAILAIHNVGTPITQNGKTTYSKEDLRKKAEKAEELFEKDEWDALMRLGVCGNTPPPPGKRPESVSKAPQKAPNGNKLSFDDLKSLEAQIDAWRSQLPSSDRDLEHQLGQGGPLRAAIEATFRKLDPAVNFLDPQSLSRIAAKLHPDRFTGNDEAQKIAQSIQTQLNRVATILKKAPPPRPPAVAGGPRGNERSAHHPSTKEPATPSSSPSDDPFSTWVKVPGKGWMKSGDARKIYSPDEVAGFTSIPAHERPSPATWGIGDTIRGVELPRKRGDPLPATYDYVILRDSKSRPGEYTIGWKKADGSWGKDVYHVEKKVIEDLWMKKEIQKALDRNLYGVKDTAIQKKIMSLTDAERPAIADMVIGKKLTPDQVIAVLEAHKLPKDQLNNKMRILEKAGLRRDDADKLLRFGVCGIPPPPPPPLPGSTYKPPEKVPTHRQLTEPEVKAVEKVKAECTKEWEQRITAGVSAKEVEYRMYPLRNELHMLESACKDIKNPITPTQMREMFSAITSLHQYAYKNPKIDQSILSDFLQYGSKLIHLTRNPSSAQDFITLVSEGQKNNLEKLPLKYLLSNYYTYAERFGANPDLVNNITTKILPGFVNGDDQVKALFRGQAMGAFYESIGTGDFIFNSFAKKITAPHLHELQMMAKTAPATSSARLEQNRNDALGLMRCTPLLRDFIHDQRPMVHDVLSEMVRYYKTGDANKLNTLLSQTKQSGSPWLSREDATIGILDRSRYDLKTKVSQDGGMHYEELSVIDLLKRMAKNTKPVDDVPPRTSDPILNTKLGALSEQKSKGPLSEEDLGKTVDFMNDKLLTMMKNGEVGIEPNSLLAITWLEQECFRVMQKLSFERASSAYKYPWFKSILKFQELTASPHEYNEQEFSKFIDQLNSASKEDASRLIAERVMNHTYELAQKYKGSRYEGRIGAIWSGNTMHELMVPPAMRPAETTIGEKHRQESSNPLWYRNWGD